MGFADELRVSAEVQRQEREERLQAKLQAELQAELAIKTMLKERNDRFQKDRMESIYSGKLVEDYYKWFKKDLIDYAKKHNSSDDDNRRKGELIYLVDEYLEKRQAHKNRTYMDKLDRIEGFEAIETSHTIFSKEESEVLQQQLIACFKNDGFKYDIKIREELRTVYERTETGIKSHGKVLWGYTILFEVMWFPWDSTKSVSHSALNKIRRICSTFLSTEDAIWNSPTRCQKLIATLGLSWDQTLFCSDSTIFHSGKEGYALAQDGIYHAKYHKVSRFKYQELADSSIEEYASKIRLGDIYLELGASHTEAERKLLKDIQKVIREDLLSK